MPVRWRCFRQNNPGREQHQVKLTFLSNRAPHEGANALSVRYTKKAEHHKCSAFFDLKRLIRDQAVTSTMPLSIRT